MRKFIIAVIVAGALFAVGAFAASFALNAQDVSSDADDVLACTAAPTVTWTIDATDAVATVTSLAVPNFTITGANIQAGAGCDARQFRLAVEGPGTTERLCQGTFSAAGVGTVTFVSASTCTLSATPLKVNDVTAAALLIGDATLAVTPTIP